MRDSAKIKWDEKYEIATTPIGNFHVGMEAIINSKGNLGTSFFAVIDHTRALLFHSIPNHQQAINLVEDHYNKLISSLVESAPESIEEDIKEISE